jgi:heat shock protein HtpX
MINVYEQIDSNKRKSVLIVFSFILFAALVVYWLGRSFGYSPSFAGVAFIFAGLTGLIGYYQGDKIILSLSRARPADRKKDFKLFTVVENLSLASQIPLPRVYLIDDTAMNAFATGRDPEHAVVCATTGLVERLSRTELEGVIAHEIAHIKNFDIRLMSLVSVLVGSITLIADWFLRTSSWGGRGRRKNGGVLIFLGLVLALLSPLVARLIQLAISRSREFLADASAVMITRFPDGLAGALEKIAADKEPLEAANKATAHLFIANPLKNHHDRIGWFASLFNTHPSIEERIKKLRQMS